MHIMGGQLNPAQMNLYYAEMAEKSEVRQAMELRRKRLSFTSLLEDEPLEVDKANESDENSDEEQQRRRHREKDRSDFWA